MTITEFKPQELIGYIFPVGARCLSCMTKEQVAKAEKSPAFVPIRWNIPLSDGEITCDGCETVLQES